MSSRRLPPKNEVLELFASADRKPLDPREVAKKLDVPEGSFQALVNMLDDMVNVGQLSSRPGDKYKLADSQDSKRPMRDGRDGGGGRDRRNGGSSNRFGGGDRPRASATGDEREGTLSVNQRGFGFVSSLGASGDDVFVPREALKGAMHGDKVVVQLRSRGPKGVEGDIVRIVDRGMKRVAGVLRRRGKSAWLEPDDQRVRGPIPLPNDIDATGPEGNSGKDGDAVIVTITRYPELPDETPVGKLDAVLGTPGELKVEVAKILAMAGIEEVHSTEAFSEAEAYGIEVPKDMLEGRVDLTHLPLPTIDPEDARDHDDAVWVERAGDGGYTAWVAIADVSSYVRKGTILDAESMKRGCSIYLPDRAIPMLPRPLSSNLCSLLPDVIRLCLCVVADIDAGGHVTKAKVVRGFMKSRAKLTYGGVARALGMSDKPPKDPKAEELIEGLRVAQECSRLLRVQRMKRGSLDFDLPEAKIILDEKGHPTDVIKRTQDPGMKKAYALIEDLMLLANECVATWLTSLEIPTVYRVHAPPDEKKLMILAAMCESLGVPFDAEDARDPKKLQLLLRSFAEHPQVQVLNMLLLRSMKQATYDIVNIGHFGLASKSYLHFTSPIRRYPDLVVHRTVHSELLGERGHKGAAAAEKLGEAALAASTAERKAMEIEREVVDLYRAVMMRDRMGERYEGTVTALVGSGIFVQLDAPFVDVLVRLEDLGGDRWELDEETMRVIAPRSGESIGLGDKLIVEIVDVQILRRTVYGRRIGGGASGESLPRGAGGSYGRRGDGGGGNGPPGKKGIKFAPRDGKPGKKDGKKSAQAAPPNDRKARAGKRKIEKRAAKAARKGGGKGGKRG